MNRTKLLGMNKGKHRLTFMYSVDVLVLKELQNTEIGFLMDICNEIVKMKN